MTKVKVTVRNCIPNLFDLVEFNYKNKSYSAIVPVAMLKESGFLAKLVNEITGVETIGLGRAE